MLEHALAYEPNVFGRRAAAAADEIHQAARCELGQHGGGHFRGLVVLAKSVRQSRVRIRADAGVSQTRELRDVRTELACAQGAIEADRYGPCVAH